MTEEEEKYTQEGINNAITALGIMLDDAMKNALNTRYCEKYEDYDFDLITSFECMLDDVSRIANVIDLHDALARAGSRDLLYAFTKDVDNVLYMDKVNDMVIDGVNIDVESLASFKSLAKCLAKTRSAISLNTLPAI